MASDTAKNSACDTCSSKTSTCNPETCGQNKKPEQIDQENKIKANLAKIKNCIAVVSGKGGVGKSTVTAGMAVSLARKGYKVGVMDADISGPNMPHLLDVEDQKMKANVFGLLPVEAVHGIKVVSIESLITSSDSPVVWRGPMRSSVINQFLSDVVWGELDFLLVDLPPGTGDEPLSIMQTLPLNGIVIVTTSSNLSILDVSKIVNMAKMLNVNILGVVENMAYLECPDCHKKIFPFGENTVKDLCSKYGLEVIGSIPMDVENRGTDIIFRDDSSPIVTSTDNIATRVLDRIKA